MGPGMARRPDEVKRGRSVLFAPRDPAADDQAGKPDGEKCAVGRFGNGNAAARLRERSSGGGDKCDKDKGNKAEHAGDFQYKTLPKS
jgi:hypothetical protein